MRYTPRLNHPSTHADGHGALRGVDLAVLVALALLAFRSANADTPKERRTDSIRGGAAALGSRCSAAMERAQKASEDSDWSYQNRFEIEEHAEGFIAKLNLNHECGYYSEFAVEITRGAGPSSPWHWTEKWRKRNEEPFTTQRAVRRANGWRASMNYESNLDKAEVSPNGRQFFNIFQKALDTCIETSCSSVPN